MDIYMYPEYKDTTAAFFPNPEAITSPSKWFANKMFHLKTFKKTRLHENAKCSSNTCSPLKAFYPWTELIVGEMERALCYSPHITVITSFHICSTAALLPNSVLIKLLKVPAFSETFTVFYVRVTKASSGSAVGGNTAIQQISERWNLWVDIVMRAKPWDVRVILAECWLQNRWD